MPGYLLGDSLIAGALLVLAAGLSGLFLMAARRRGTRAP